MRERRGPAPMGNAKDVPGRGSRVLGSAGWELRHLLPTGPLPNPLLPDSCSSPRLWALCSASLLSAPQKSHVELEMGGFARFSPASPPPARCSPPWAHAVPASLTWQRVAGGGPGLTPQCPREGGQRCPQSECTSRASTPRSPRAGLWGSTKPHAEPQAGVLRRTF